MPDTLDTAVIDPDALKAARKRRGMTQQQLAKKLECTKDTVSRWERGKHSRVWSHLRERFPKALGVSFEELTRPPERKTEEPDRVEMRLTVNRATRNALRLVALRYGVRSADIVNLAPLLFLFVAELSLLERKRWLEDAEEAQEAFWKMGQESDEKLHKTPLGKIINNSWLDWNDDIPSVEDVLAAERRSINVRDLFGENYQQLLGDYEDVSEQVAEKNPFSNFIERIAESFPEYAIESVDGWAGDFPRRYRIAGDTLREHTGISRDSGDDEKFLLHYLQDGSIDLDECLRVKRERDDDGYRQWLEEEKSKAASESLMILFSEPNTESTPPGVSEQDAPEKERSSVGNREEETDQ